MKNRLLLFLISVLAVVMVNIGTICARSDGKSSGQVITLTEEPVTLALLQAVERRQLEQFDQGMGSGQAHGYMWLDLAVAHV